MNELGVCWLVDTQGNAFILNIFRCTLTPNSFGRPNCGQN